MESEYVERERVQLKNTVTLETKGEYVEQVSYS